jgi:tryptophanyl-tRNA synthetase
MSLAANTSLNISNENASSIRVAKIADRIPGKSRVLTGIKPTDIPHLGNYFGAIKPMIDASKADDSEVFLMCADWHGLTDKQKIMQPASYTVPTLATMVVLGFNLNGNALFCQSMVPEIMENAWYLSCVSGVGLLERAHAFKDAVQSGKDATCGLFYYPILMASDILSFDTEFVPVGKDQAQHIEYASDMAKSFKAAVEKDCYVEPKARINSETPLLLGIDGERKMGKSYNNHIPMFASKKEVEKRVKEIKTDSKGLDDPKDPDNNLIYKLFTAFASQEAQKHMHEKLRVGTGYGYGHAKKDFLEEYERVFGAKREEYEHYVNNRAELFKLLEPGLLRVRSIAAQVTRRARDCLGLVN